MKFFFTTIALFLFLLRSEFSVGQNFFLPGDTSFFQVAVRNNSISVDTNGFESKYELWKRYEAFWAPRLMPSGLMKNSKNAYRSYFDELQNNNNQNLNQNNNLNFGDWNDLGPNALSGVFSSAVDIGRISRVQVDYDDISGNTIYASSPVGGIFKTTDGGQNWINYDTDNSFGLTSITDIQLVSTVPLQPGPNVKYLYAAVGGEPLTSCGPMIFNGIWRRQIGTSGWVNLTGNLTCPGMLDNQFAQVHKMLISPLNPNRIYLATSQGVFYSCVGGCVPNVGFCNATPGLNWKKANVTEDVNGLEWDYSDITYNSLYCSARQVWHTQDLDNNGLISITNTSLNTSNAFNDLNNLPLNTVGSWSNKDYIFISTNSLTPNKLILLMTNLPNPGSGFGVILEYDKTSLVQFPNNFTYKVSSPLANFPEIDKTFIHHVKSNPDWIVWTQSRTSSDLRAYNLVTANNEQFSAVHADVLDFGFTLNDIIVSSDGGVAKTNLSKLNGTGGSPTSINGNGLGVAQIYGISIWEKSGNKALIGLQDSHIKQTDDLAGGNGWITIPGGDGQTPLYLNDGSFFTQFSGIQYNYTVDIGKACGDVNHIGNFPYKSINGEKEIYVGGTEIAYNYDPLNSTNGQCPGNGWAYNISNLSLYNPCGGYRAVIFDFAVSQDHNTMYASYIPLIKDDAICTQNAIDNMPIIMRTTSGGINNPHSPNPCNGAQCWQSLGTLNSLNLVGYISTICMRDENPQEIWVGCSGYKPTNGSNLRRVLYSLDGGNTFVDFSQGLLNFPVNKIIYRKGSNFELFAATDVGVYYRNSLMTEWKKIFSNLPDCIINDLQIDNCNDKLYAGTFGRGLWSLDLPPPVNPLSVTTITLSNNNAPITYSTTQYFFNNILVKAGSIVQFSNTSIYMGPNTKITVEPGAILRITGSTVQSYCDKNMWEGIHCLGTASVSHQQSIQQNGFYSAHGRVYVHNNSLIKDAARAAVFLDQGGVVQAYDSRFENNRKDLEFHIFSFPNNHSIAQNCVFETNADTKKVSNGIDSHVTAWAVDGVTFRGCTFQNIAPQGSNNNNLGNGIGAEDAFLKIDNYCQGNCTVQPQPSNHTVFKNLAYGIYAQGVTSNLRSFYVRNTDFENCQRGVYIKNMDWAKFQFCDFKIPSDQLQYGPYVLNSPYGLYFDNCQNFFCENNKFTGLPGLQLASAATGVYVNNSNANATRVYNCDFTNLQVGSAGLFDNYYESITNSESVGLRFNCNKYTECNYDVAVMGGAFNYVPTNIDNVQGSWTSFPSITDFSKTVRNLYSAICQINDQNQYYNDKIVNGQYIHYNQAIQLNNGGNYFTQPQNNCFDQNKLLPIPLYPQFPFIRDESSCPTYGIESGAPCLDCNLAALNVNISNLKSQIVTETAKLTGAASQTLISLINSNISNGDLINVLITQSPLLSDPVLLAYFNKAGIPPGHIKQVHGLNAPVSEAVWQVIDNLNLPPGIENQIIKAQMAATQVNGGLSGRRNFEANVSSLKSQATYLLNEKTRIFLSDSIERNVDSLKVIIQNPIYADRDLKLLDFYISTAQYSLASSQNSQIALRRGTSYAPYNNVKSMIISALSSTLGLSGLSQDATIEGYLHSLANTDFSPGQKEAQALSDFVFNKKYLEYTLLPEVSSPDGSRPMKEEQKEKSPITDNPKLNAIPNPASGDVVIQYQLPQGANYGILKVLDITGREVYKTDVITSLDKIYLSTKDWANGMYYYSLTVNNQIIGVKTIVIAK